MNCLLIAAAQPLALANVNHFAGNVILARQGGDSFIPPTEGVTSCAVEDQCGGGDNSPVVCLVRSLGDTCCAENYGCPGGSFCLTKGYCCPNGDDPSTCAAQNGITLPPGFKAGQTIAPGGPTSSPSAVSATSLPAVSSSPSALSHSPSSEIVAATSTSVSAPLYSTPSNATSHGPVIAPTGTLKPSSTAVPFTGDANMPPVGSFGLYITIGAAFAALLMF